uniref:Uncharacterized protein n=1 Tax=Salix viminalis TaxID=40686 RepID=A0A6N2KQW8_SALVM
MILRFREIGKAGGPRLTSLSIKTPPRGELKLQDEYVLDSRIHSQWREVNSTDDIQDECRPSGRIIILVLGDSQEPKRLS